MARRWFGFSVVEQMVALLMVALTALLLIRSNTANSIIFQNASRRASAVRLASEFSAWVRRGGHLGLGMPLEQALKQSSSTNVPSNTCCVEFSCDNSAIAWHYLTAWQRRLRQVIPDARVMVCLGDVNSSATTDWTCATHGSALLMKLGWPITTPAPALVIPIGME